jgi:hypothetical protein
MKPTILLMPALFIALSPGAKSADAQAYYGPPPFAYAQQHAEQGWERQGFYAGINGAEHDFWNHRRPDVNNRDEYRDPDSVPRWARREYREGFRRGYYFRARQIYSGQGRRW